MTLSLWNVVWVVFAAWLVLAAVKHCTARGVRWTGTIRSYCLTLGAAFCFQMSLPVNIALVPQLLAILALLFVVMPMAARMTVALGGRPLAGETSTPRH